MSVPFRLLAIAGSTTTIEEIFRAANRLPTLRVGVMLRDADHDPARVAGLALHALAVGVPPGVALIPNGVELDGIDALHLPAARLDDWSAREGRPAILGASTHSLDEVRRAEALGADYVTFGPIHPTRSKPGHPGLGIDALREVTRVARIPIFPLGGITAARIPDLLAAGAHGVAAISLFDDPTWVTIVPRILHGR